MVDAEPGGADGGQNGEQQRTTLILTLNGMGWVPPEKGAGIAPALSANAYFFLAYFMGVQRDRQNDDAALDDELPVGLTLCRSNHS